MVRCSLKISDLKEGHTFSYHQHALAKALFSTRSGRSVPSELVLPDGEVTIGAIPTSFLDGNQGVQEESEEERLNQARTGSVVGYASASDGFIVQPELQKLAAYLFLCVMAQAVCIVTAVAANGDVWPLSSPGFHGPDGTRRVLYFAAMASHVLPVVALLYRLPWLLVLYNTSNTVLFCLVFIQCLYCVLDVLVMATLVALRLVGSRMRFHMVSHVFILPAPGMPA